MTSRDPAVLRAGYRSAREVARTHAKSFYFASHVLFGRRRRAAFALYAFCRRLDDMVDVEPSSGVMELQDRLEGARCVVAELYSTLPDLAAKSAPGTGTSSLQVAVHWNAPELAALADTVETFHIPEQPFQDLISGMQMDLFKTRYRNYAELDLYCYRVAGVVGLMLTRVLGFEDEAAFGPAVALGKAMQLTNILRDVGEDLDRGRCYLPGDELDRFGLTPEILANPQVASTADFKVFMQGQIRRARSLYSEAAGGIPLLRGFAARHMVRLMGAIYGDLLREIEARDYQVLNARARVSGARKMVLATKALFLPRQALMPRAVLSLPAAVDHREHASWS